MKPSYKAIRKIENKITDLKQDIRWDERDLSQNKISLLERLTLAGRRYGGIVVLSGSSLGLFGTYVLGDKLYDMFSPLDEPVKVALVEGYKTAEVVGTEAGIGKDAKARKGIEQKLNELKEMNEGKEMLQNYGSLNPKDIEMYIKEMSVKREQAEIVVSYYDDLSRALRDIWMQAKGGNQKTDEAIRNSAEKIRSNPEEKNWFEKIFGMKDIFDSAVRGDSKKDPSGDILRDKKLRWFEAFNRYRVMRDNSTIYHNKSFDEFLSQINSIEAKYKDADNGEELALKEINILLEQRKGEVAKHSELINTAYRHWEISKDWMDEIYGAGPEGMTLDSGGRKLETIASEEGDKIAAQQEEKLVPWFGKVDRSTPFDNFSLASLIFGSLFLAGFALFGLVGAYGASMYARGIAKFNPNKVRKKIIKNMEKLLIEECNFDEMSKDLYGRDGMNAFMEQYYVTFGRNPDGELLQRLLANMEEVK